MFRVPGFIDAPFSWLLPLDGFQYIFLLRDSKNDLLRNREASCSSRSCSSYALIKRVRSGHDFCARIERSRSKYNLVPRIFVPYCACWGTRPIKVLHRRKMSDWSSRDHVTLPNSKWRQYLHTLFIPVERRLIAA